MTIASKQPLILLIEDETPIRKFLLSTLTNEGYRMQFAETAAAGLRLASQQPPDLILLDLGLPDLDGQEVLSRLREWYSGPIVILSARDQESQKVAALDSGADDYLTKPFGTSELMARLRVALRHATAQASGIEQAVYSVGDLRIDLAARRVFCGADEVHLTPIEYKLLTTLIRHAGKVLTHRFLLKEVWGPGQTSEIHYLRVHMASLRRKLETDSANPRYLLTEQGVGYRLATET